MRKYKDRIIKVLIRILFWIFFGDSFALSLSALKLIISSLTGHSTASLAGPVIVLAGTVPTALAFGRYYCGYICSFGAMQELCSYVGSKAFSRKYIMPQKADRALKFIPYAVLAIVTCLCVFGTDINPSYSPWAAFGKIFTVKSIPDLSSLLSLGGILLVIIIIAALFINRPFCSFFCPLGAIYKLSAKAFSRFRVSDERRKCTNCGECSVCCRHCKNEKISYPALIATIAVFVLMNFLWNFVTERSEVSYEVPTVESQRGLYTDGSYTGSGKGYRGNIEVCVSVENGYITEITINSSKDDKAYIERVRTELIPKIIESQRTDVDAVSGASYSSRGLISAVDDALSSSEEESSETVFEELVLPASFDAVLEELSDGSYIGSAMGFKGELQVEVSVKDHMVEKIRLISYYDTEAYLFYAAPRVFDGITEGQSLELDAVSGATYSRNGLVQAVANALGVDDSTYSLADARERADKDKPQRHIVQKFVESEEQYLELVEKYSELIYGADGKKINN